MYKAILFDLDGTLTDSGEGITKSVQYALEKIGKPEPDLSKLRCFVGPPLHEQFKQYAGIDDETADDAIRFYRERYAPIGIFENIPYEGIAHVLEILKYKGYLLAVASSKPEHFVRIVLERFDLEKYFDVICGASLDGTLSEKADIIRYALQKLESYGPLKRQQVIMVGDTKYDVIGARELDMDCLAVGYGYGTRQELEEAEPLTIVETTEEILDFFA